MIYEVDINEETDKGKMLLTLLKELNFTVLPKNKFDERIALLLNKSAKQANEGLVKEHTQLKNEVESWLNSK
jgi:hypothetical protein